MYLEQDIRRTAKYLPLKSAVFTNHSSEDSSEDIDVEINGIFYALAPAGVIITITETILLAVPSKKATLETKLHIGDFKVVENGGNISRCGPFSFQVRRAIT